MLTARRCLLRRRVRTCGTEALVGPVASLRHVLATNASLGDKILKAFMGAGSALVSGSKPSSLIRLVGSQFSHEAQRLRESWPVPGSPMSGWTPTATFGRRIAREIGVDEAELPVVVMSGEVLRKPTPGALASYLGLTIESIPNRCFDLVVIGGGPGRPRSRRLRRFREGLRRLGIEMTMVGWPGWLDFVYRELSGISYLRGRRRSR